MTMNAKQPPQDYEPLTAQQIFSRCMCIPVLPMRLNEKELDLLKSDRPAETFPQELVDKIRPTFQEWGQALI